jgi:hypothetical protein
LQSFNRVHSPAEGKATSCCEDRFYGLYRKYGVMDSGKLSFNISRLLLWPSSTFHTWQQQQQQNAAETTQPVSSQN